MPCTSRNKKTAPRKGSQQDVSMLNVDLADDKLGWRIDLTASKVRSTFLVANLMAPDASHHMGRLSPNRRKLVRNLEKVVNKCIDRNCEGDHPTTDLLCERIYAALEGAVLNIEVDEIMCRHVSKAENSKNDDRHVRWSFGFQ
ncbi:uncharacterized protein F5147DRAFT_653188 [Suillus discolor]|uniref:Uncharacterized protein n=1 Tax=Suillus discolor TaxID=1912936 RepID=A0A9P7JTQ1_9AGAM|nr:uncharacterized protein F5147DRAFT_653188 [Suillus discolor]KAG2107660.1 hypothetical protein F5147DRAFT_653188 [Suillus discolor]